MSATDNDANAFYSDPENLRPAGPARRRSEGRVLSSHIPVRFNPSLVVAVKAIADLEGLSVSTWIRRLVTREIERHRPPVTGAAEVIEMSWAFGETQPVGQTGSSSEGRLALAN